MSKKDWQLLQQYKASGLTPERAKELGAADAEGRLAVLPCKMGAQLFVVIIDEELNGQHTASIHRDKAEEFLVCDKGVLVGNGEGCFDEIGKDTVYLDRAEAEQAAETLLWTTSEAQP